MTVYEIIKELENNSSRNKKVEILRENEHNLVLKDVILKTYDPYVDYYVKKLPKIIKEGKLTVEESWEKFSSILTELSERKLSGNNARNTITSFLETVNKDSQYIYSFVLNRKFLKVGVNSKSINKVWYKLINDYHPQLANKYEVPKIHKYPDHFYWSTKLDGIRCTYINEKNFLLSRTGRDIDILEDIKSSCKNICKDFNLDFIDGELFSKKLTFNDIQSAVMSRKNLKPELLKYIKLNVFAVVKDDINDTKEMADILQNIKKKNYNKINIVDQNLITHDLNQIVSKTVEMIQLGFEGIMLRHPYNYYTWNRSDNLLKVKDFQLREILNNVPEKLDAPIRKDLKTFLAKRNIELSDFKITAVEEGTGNFKGMLGAFIIQGKVDNRIITSRVGTGLKLDERIKYWQIKDSLIGKEVELICQEITKDNSIRFPVIKEVKLDR